MAIAPKSYQSGELGPARNAAVVVPNDGADIGFISRGLYVGVAGNIAVVMASGDSVVIPVQPGLHPLAVARVLSTGTTATGIVAIW